MLRMGVQMFILSYCKEVNEKELLELQKQLDEIASIVGNNSALYQLVNEILDNAEKIS